MRVVTRQPCVVDAQLGPWLGVGCPRWGRLTPCGVGLGPILGPGRAPQRGLGLARPAWDHTTRVGSWWAHCGHRWSACWPRVARLGFPRAGLAIVMRRSRFGWAQAGFGPGPVRAQVVGDGPNVSPGFGSGRASLGPSWPWGRLRYSPDSGDEVRPRCVHARVYTCT